MKKYIVIIASLSVAIILWLLFASFKKKTLNENEYIKWIQDTDNGFVNSKEMDGYTFELQYNPTDYMIARETAKKKATKEEIADLKNAYKGLQYFTLKMKTDSDKDMLDHNCENAEQRMMRAEYLMGVMQDDIYLIEGKDTLPCVLYHFEQNYGIAPFNHISLAFSNPDSLGLNEGKNDKTILVNERVFGLGRMYFTISGSDIAKAPHLANDKL